MTIPIATTTIQVLRVPADPTRDPTEPGVEAEVAGGVRAHISTATGSEQLASGAAQERVYFRLAADPCDLEHNDVVVDEATGERYEVQWVRHRQELGMDHVQAGLRQVTGTVSRAR